MKILQITNSYSLTGGVGKYVQSLTGELRKRGHECIVIHSDINQKNNELDYFVKNFDAFQAPDQKQTTAEVMEILNRENPDIVHIQSNMNFDLEKKIRAKFPAIKSLHVYDFCPSGTKYHFAQQKACVHKPGLMCLPRMAYKRCAMDKNPSTLWMFYDRPLKAAKNDRRYSKVLVASEYVREQAVHAGFKTSQIEVLPYYAEPPLNDTAPLLPGPEKIILATGRLVREKGIDKLLYAVSYIAKRQDWKLAIDGEGPDLKRLKALTSRLGLNENVLWLGWLPSDKHLALFKQASVVVVPSVWPEPFGLVGIEAMRSAKPVIAFNVGGIPGWLENGKTGFLIEPYDLQKMAEKIELLLENNELRCELGEQGFKTAGAFFTPDRHVSKLLSFYQSLIQQSNKTV
jgi:glycosyltransferase involved in cell wall biosynthesis